MDPNPSFCYSVLPGAVSSSSSFVDRQRYWWRVRVTKLFRRRSRTLYHGARHGHCAERRRCRSKLIIGVVAPANPRRKWTDALCDAVPPVFRTSVGRRRAAAAGGHSGGFERDPAGRRRTGRRPSTTLLIGLAKPGLRRGPERAPRWTDSPARRHLGRR